MLLQLRENRGFPLDSMHSLPHEKQVHGCAAGEKHDGTPAIVRGRSNPREMFETPKIDVKSFRVLP